MSLKSLTRGPFSAMLVALAPSGVVDGFGVRDSLKASSAMAEPTAASSSRWTRPPIDGSSPLCLLARFPKTGGSAATLMSKAAGPGMRTLRENGNLRLKHVDSDALYIIGQTRNPFDWYSSLWAYLSDDGRPPSITPAALSKVRPCGSTEEDVGRFRHFVRLFAPPRIGAFRCV